MNILSNQLNKILRTGIAIDLGTANTLAKISDSDWLLFEPSVVCINQQNKTILEVGADARSLAGRTPEFVQCLRPLQDGVINEFMGAEALLKMAISKSLKQKQGILRPLVIVGVPSLVSEVEMMALLDAARSAGAGLTYAVYEPVAAAIGAGWDLLDSRARLIADIGGGTTDIVVLSQGRLLVDKTIKIAGDEMDLAIQNYLQNKYNISISLFMAEDLKIKHANLDLLSSSKQQEIKILGRDFHSGLPKSIGIKATELAEAILPVWQKITTAIMDAMSSCSAEALNDLEAEGIYLAGGGAEIPGLANYVSKVIGIKAKIVLKPQQAVLQGNLQLINDHKLRGVLEENGILYK